MKPFEITGKTLFEFFLSKIRDSVVFSKISLIQSIVTIFRDDLRKREEAWWGSNGEGGLGRLAARPHVLRRLGPAANLGRRGHRRE